MGAEANLKKDAFFLRLVQKGKLVVDTKLGTVFNTATKKYLGFTHPSGYIYFSYGKHPITKQTHSMKVHRLVYVVANGLITDPTLHVNHINGIKDDNRACNLNLLTAKQNTQHAIDTGLNTLDYMVGEKHGASLFTDVEVKQLRKRVAAGTTIIHDIVTAKDCTYQCVKYMLDGSNYSHLNDGTEQVCAKLIAVAGKNASRGENSSNSVFKNKEVAALRKRNLTGRLTLADIEMIAAEHGTKRCQVIFAIEGVTYGNLPHAAPLCFELPKRKTQMDELERHRDIVLKLYADGYSIAKIVLYLKKLELEITHDNISRFLTLHGMPRRLTKTQQMNQHKEVILSWLAAGKSQATIAKLLAHKYDLVVSSHLVSDLVAAWKEARISLPPKPKTTKNFLQEHQHYVLALANKGWYHREIAQRLSDKYSMYIPREAISRSIQRWQINTPNVKTLPMAKAG